MPDTEIGMRFADSVRNATKCLKEEGRAIIGR